MKKTKFFLTVFLFCFFFLSAQDNMIPEIQLLRENLEDTYHEYIKAGITREVDLYPHALARIDLALQSLNEDPESEKARNEFEFVQFIIEAARIQMVAAKNYAISLDLQAETESILRDVNSIRDQIIQIEKELKELQTAKLNQQLKDAENRFRNIQNEMIVVNSDARGTIISMSDLLYEIGSAELTCELKTNLAKIAGILLIYKDFDILVEGHTDNIGSEEFNLSLSQQRADNVTEFFQEIGIAKERLSAEGFGFSHPVTDNSTAAGRKKNRRVDIIINE